MILIHVNSNPFLFGVPCWQHSSLNE